MGEGFSIELCGGTHVARTGDIGLLKITSESGIASGVRRIEAVTGEAALNWFRGSEQLLAELSSLVKGTRDNLVDKVRGLNERNRQLEKEIERLTAKLASARSEDLLNQVIEVEGVRVVAARLEGVEAKALRDSIDQLKNKLGSGVVVLITAQGEKVSVAAGVSKDLTGRVKAGDLVRELAGQLGGKGGGRPDMAQGGGSNVAAIPAALEAVPALVAGALQQV